MRRKWFRKKDGMNEKEEWMRRKDKVEEKEA